MASVVASGLLPGAIEMMEPLAVEAAEAAVHPNCPQDAGAVLIVELEGEAAPVEREFERLEGLIAESGAYEVRVARDESDRARIWKGRNSAFSAVGRWSMEVLDMAYGQ